jgi:phage terminase large subunit
MTETIKFPEKLKFLFQKARYKVAHGGRGSAKSWSFARALLILGASAPERILCAREIQKSIKQSVHQLLKDQIEALGLGYFYEVLDTEIRGKNGTVFYFTGLAEHTVDTLKSFEGCTLCWVEEAQTVSKKSWQILIPTIRKDDSEIWISMNPILDTDETYVRFVQNPPPDAIVAQVNYNDNPWFNAVLEKERKHCQITAKEDYENIWLGKCRSSIVGAIYAEEIDLALREGRIGNVPYDPRLKVHTIWDLGWNDSMTIIMAQRIRSELRVIDYIEEDHKTLDWYVATLQERKFNWGYDWLPHDGKHKDFKTGKSTEEILRAFGRKPKMVPNISIEDGIKAARMTMRQTYFDKAKAGRLVECLKRYRRQVNANTNEPGAPLHDEYSHGADDYRYLSLVAERIGNEELNRVPTGQAPRPVAPGMG